MQFPILNLISGPRNISTALMYSFAQRKDTHVLDEPFYAVYLDRSGVDHPGREEVLKSQSRDENEVVKEILAQNERSVVFVKNMAHHIEVLEGSFLDRCVNIFLIRDPKQIISSYAEVIRNPVMRDIGIEFQHHLYKELVAAGRTPVVVDSGYVLENPRQVLTKLCESVGLPFDESMLSWAAGPKPYDGVWAPHWYANVHRSTGFERQSTSSRPLPADLAKLCDRATSFYSDLLSQALRP